MVNTPTYSSILHCIYDEPNEIGSIGHGSHYSVFRVPEWLDVTGQPVKQALQHDFAVIWDEDHDTRIIPVLENLYFAGLLYPLQFIGERKGGITAILATKQYFAHTLDIEAYKAKFEKIAGEVDKDWWSTEFGVFDKSFVDGVPHQTDLTGLISDEEQKVDTYIRNIDNLWKIGSWKPMHSKISSDAPKMA